MLAILAAGRVWLVLGILAVVVLLWAGWDDLQSWRLRRVTDKQGQENVEVLKQGTETKQAVEALRRQRDTAVKKAASEAAEKRRLLEKVDQLERTRSAVPQPKTLQEAAEALRALGY